MKIADESAIRCCTSATMDRKTVLGRYEHEGFSFLTITLPSFGKDFQKSLDQGYVDRSLFQGFSWRAGLPRFLGGFLDRVFDRSSGVLLDDPCVDAIRAVRQLSLQFSKVTFPCSEMREKAAIREYVECEMDVRRNDRVLSEAFLADFRRISSLLFRRLFSRVDFDVYHAENMLIPKHGPGSTADRLLGNQKYELAEWTERLEKILPSGEFLLPNWSYLDQYDAIDIREPGSERPVKVISVPKTMKAPRIIAVEPTAMQYAQQALLRSILKNLERDDFLSGLIGIRDQTPNQRMARDGSRDGSLATLDLSEASDRVSNQLVRAMLAPWPHLHEAVDACRSRKADVPGFGVLRLAKFASMGSALTFPIEAMVFATIVFIGIERELRTPLTPRHLKMFRGEVRVYGDDIIVPVDVVQSSVRALRDFGLVVNSDKSFWNGKFRESCGKEYFNGDDVSIVKVRQAFPTRRSQVPEILSLVSLRNQLYFAGYWQTCKWLDDEIRGVITHFPTVLPSSPVVGRHSFLGYSEDRIGSQLHNPLVRGYVVKPQIPSDPLDGYGALIKFFLSSEASRPSGLDDDDVKMLLPRSIGKHLKQAGRAQALHLNLRWASAI